MINDYKLNTVPLNHYEGFLYRMPVFRFGIGKPAISQHHICSGFKIPEFRFVLPKVNGTQHHQNIEIRSVSFRFILGKVYIETKEGGYLFVTLTEIGKVENYEPYHTLNSRMVNSMKINEGIVQNAYVANTRRMSLEPIQEKD